MTPFSFQAFARSQRCVTFSSQSFLITITGLITDDSSSANRNIDLTMYRFTRIQTSWFLIFSTRQGRSFEKIKQKFSKNSWSFRKCLIRREREEIKWRNHKKPSMSNNINFYSKITYLFHFILSFNKLTSRIKSNEKAIDEHHPIFSCIFTSL